jgi:hypothetical protein
MSNVHADCFWVISLLGAMVCVLVIDKVWWRRKS